MPEDKKQTRKKLNKGILAIVLLSISLAVTTMALSYAVVTVDDNLFSTGSIQLNLNDGKAVIAENEFLFEPGVTVEKNFFLENQSTWDVYYKLYFDQVKGGLADVLTVEILDGDDILLSGKMPELTRENVGAANDMLRQQERRDLAIRIHFPEEAQNETQGLFLSFDLCADAVQTKNNPDRSFD